MTVKRFTLNSVLNFDFGICDYGEPIGSLRNTCELLNELHEENDVLKQELKTKAVVNRQYEELQRLKKENEQLKQQMQTILNLTKKIEDCTHDIKLIGDVE